MTFLTQDVTERGYLYYDSNCSSGDGEGSLKPQVLVENSKKMREESGGPAVP